MKKEIGIATSVVIAAIIIIAVIVGGVAIWVTRPEPAPPGVTTLKVTTTPVNGEVFVNGVSWGTAPVSRTVDPGSYEITFGDVSGGTTPALQTVTLTAGETKTVTATYSIYKFACILPGTTADADYNFIGYIATMRAEEEFGFPVSYSEKVPVPDAKRVMEEYIEDGYNIIFVHGAQFDPATLELAPEHPEVSFIIEGEGLVDLPPNVWGVDRNYYRGAYVLGALAGLMSTTNKIGYVSGLMLPFTRYQVNGIKQGLENYCPEVELYSMWVGDFNDPAKAREITDSLIAEGCDVIIGTGNLNAYGLIESVRAAPTTVYMTNWYTDKSHFLVDRTLGAYLYDYPKKVVEITGKIMEGEIGGQTELVYGTDVYLSELYNVPEDVENIILEIDEGLRTGTIQPARIFELE